MGIRKKYACCTLTRRDHNQALVLIRSGQFLGKSLPKIAVWALEVMRSFYDLGAIVLLLCSPLVCGDKINIFAGVLKS